MTYEQYFKVLSHAERLEIITEANQAGQSLQDYVDTLLHYESEDNKDQFCFECSEPQPELKNNLCATCYEIFNNSIFNYFTK